MSIIYLLTKKYCYKRSRRLKTIDLFTLKGIKKSMSEIIIGITLPTLLFIIIIVCRSNVVPNTSIHGISIITRISTFIGMSILEECIFRGILQSTFEIYSELFYLQLKVNLVLYLRTHFIIYRVVFF